MRTIKSALAAEAARRDTTLVPPLGEILAAMTMFVAVMAVFIG
jgi:hypothetical protein